MRDFLVTWLDPSETRAKHKNKSERFIETPEMYVDGFVQGLRKSGMEIIHKNEV